MSPAKTVSILVTIGAVFAAGIYLGRTSDSETPTPTEQTVDAPTTAIQQAVPETEAPIIEEEPIDFTNASVELRNANGQTIQAELLSLDGQVLTIRRDDSQEFSFDLGMLVEADRYYVMKHFEGRPSAALAETLGEQKEYVIPDSIEYLDTLYNQLLQGTQ